MRGGEGFLRQFEKTADGFREITTVDIDRMEWEKKKKQLKEQIAYLKWQLSEFEQELALMNEVEKMV